jgi:iron complex transport system ATP-binding protein
MIEATNITVNYGERTGVVDVSLRAEPGELMAIIGPNGAGKSTLLRTLNQSIAATRGEIRLNGQPLASYSRRAIARRVAVVAQEAELRFPITVLEFVLGGRFAWSSAWGWESEHDVEIAREVLRETELEELGSRLMNELSGGERQRAVVARALATEAKVFLLDEPTANLDLAHQALMLKIVRGRCDHNCSTAIVVTHELNLAAEFADQIVLLKGGQEVATGPPLLVLTPELLRQVFEIEVLVDAHPISGAPRITPVHSISGRP